MHFFGESRSVDFENLTLYIIGSVEAHTDLEILKKYYKDGKAFLDEVDGSFVFAILNKTTNSLFITTDFYGTKFIYYSFNNGFNFSADPKKLESDIDSDAVELYFRFGTIPLELSPYRGVKKLLPNSYLEIDLISLKYSIKKHNSIDSQIEKYTLKEAMDLVETGLENKIEKIENIENNGVFLSGGIDSGLIAYYARKRVKNLKTFTIAFDDSYDESSDAQTVAKLLKTDHKTINIASDLNSDLTKILSISKEPFSDSSIVPSYYASFEAKKYVDSIILGDGSDEIFAGYRRYVPVVNRWYDIAKRFGFLLPILPEPTNKQNIYNWIYRLINSADSKSYLEFWLKSRVDLIDIENNKQSDLINKKLSKITGSKLTKELLADHKLLLFSDLIPKMRIANESNNLLSHSPFLSKELYKIAFSLEDRFKINGTKTKYILREIYAKNIDREIAYRAKRGFEVPLKKWVNSTLKDQINDLVFAPNAYWKNYLDIDTVKNDYSEKDAKIIWMLFCLEVWYGNQ